MPTRRAMLMLLASLVLLPVVALIGFVATVDPSVYAPRLIESVRAATGRALSFDGSIKFIPSLWPTLTISDVRLANMAGGSRPDMLRADRLEVQLDLPALFGGVLEINRLLLIKPDFLLETDAAGRANWRFEPVRVDERRSSPPGGLPDKVPGGYRLAMFAPLVNEVRIEDGVVTYRDGRTGRSSAGRVRGLTMTVSTLDSPAGIFGRLEFNGVPISVDGVTGSLARLTDATSTDPWPVHLELNAAGANLNVNGSMTQPLTGHGYTVAVDGVVPDLAALRPLFPHAGLPPLRFATVSAQFDDDPGQIPLRTLKATGTLAEHNVTLKVRLAAAGVPAAPRAMEISAQAGGATLTASGTVTDRLIGALIGRTADPGDAASAAFAVDGRIPDLSVLASLAGRQLPPLKDFVIQARVAATAHEMTINDLRMASAQGDLSGDLQIARSPRPSLRGRLSSTRLDLDALESPLPFFPWASPAPPPAAGTPDHGQGSASPAAAAPAPSVAAPAAGGPARPKLVLTDDPWPLEALRRADADLQLAVAVLQRHRQNYRDVSAHLVLDRGRLTFDPIGAILPGGPLTAKLAIDASADEPSVAGALHTAGLALKPLLSAFGLPDDAEGTLEVDVDVRGAGGSLHQVASHAAGSVGMAMVDARLDNRLIEQILGPVARKAGLPALPLTGSTPLRCLALRVALRDGHGVIRAAALDSAPLNMTGSGAFDMGAETLALRLNPLLRVAGAGVAVPVVVTGPWRAPRLAIDTRPEPGAAKGTAGIVISALDGSGMIQGGGEDRCVSDLTIARDGRPGPAPSPVSLGDRPKPPNPAALLRQLIR